MDISKLSIATIRSLGIDTINKAKSGHPGMVLGAAPALFTLFDKELNIYHKDSSWINRDRFVLASGHASALLYSLLHLSGYDVSIEDLKNFRQLHSSTPGHPEFSLTHGVDASSGPLGQGIPMATGMAMAEKFLATKFNKENYELLGAQIVGNSGVDKRIDVLATAIRFKAKAYELTGLELSYAPPFGSAKDPINMIGYLVENLKNNLVKQVFIENIPSLIKNDSYMIIDVRTPDEYHLGHIPTSINIPLDNLRERLNEIDKTKQVCLICHSALRSYLGCRILTQNGFNVCHLSGGYRLYSSYINDK